MRITPRKREEAPAKKDLERCREMLMGDEWAQGKIKAYQAENHDNKDSGTIYREAMDLVDQERWRAAQLLYTNPLLISSSDMNKEEIKALILRMVEVNPAVLPWHRRSGIVPTRAGGYSLSKHEIADTLKVALEGRDYTTKELHAFEDEMLRAAVPRLAQTYPGEMLYNQGLFAKAYDARLVPTKDDRLDGMVAYLEKYHPQLKETHTRSPLELAIGMSISKKDFETYLKEDVRVDPDADGMNQKTRKQAIDALSEGVLRKRLEKEGTTLPSPQAFEYWTRTAVACSPDNEIDAAVMLGNVSSWLPAFHGHASAREHIAKGVEICQTKAFKLIPEWVVAFKDGHEKEAQKIVVEMAERYPGTALEHTKLWLPLFKDNIDAAQAIVTKAVRANNVAGLNHVKQWSEVFADHPEKARALVDGMAKTSPQTVPHYTEQWLPLYKDHPEELAAMMEKLGDDHKQHLISRIKGIFKCYPREYDTLESMDIFQPAVSQHRFASLVKSEAAFHYAEANESPKQINFPMAPHQVKNTPKQFKILLP